MVYAYFRQLTPAQQGVYRESDEIHAIRLHDATPLWPLVAELESALRAGARVRTEAAGRALLAGLTERLGVSPLRLRVLAARPHTPYLELHGYYEPREGRRWAAITLWMRTAKQRRIVAFRTFLRTLLHELCHHLDYELLGLAESYHTEGFYKRETSLFHQLVRPLPVAAVTSDTE